MVAEQNSASRNTLLLSNLDDRLAGHEGAASAAKRTVGDNVDALFTAEVDNLLLGKAGVVLDLVDGRDNLGHREKLLKVLFAVL